MLSEAMVKKTDGNRQLLVRTWEKNHFMLLMGVQIDTAIEQLVWRDPRIENKSILNHFDHILCRKTPWIYTSIPERCLCALIFYFTIHNGIVQNMAKMAKAQISGEIYIYMIRTVEFYSGKKNGKCKEEISIKRKIIQVQNENAKYHVLT